jgi:phage tail-like protein
MHPLAATPRFWQLASAAAWRGAQGVVWDEACQRLRLASQRALPLNPPQPPASESFNRAQLALDLPSVAVDATQAVATWQPASQTVQVRSHLPTPTTLLALAEAPKDLCAGVDGVLYVALGGRVLLHDLRGRWADATARAADAFEPWRLAPHPQGGVWALERATGRLACVRGQPLSELTLARTEYDARTFRPTPENGNPPRTEAVAPPAWAAGDRAVALASGPDGAVAVLVWQGGEGRSLLYRWDAEHGRYAAPCELQGVAYAHALAFVAADRVVLRVPGLVDAPAYALPPLNAPASVLWPLGEIYPLPPEALEAPFAQGATSPPQVPLAGGLAQPLHPLSLWQLARQGEAAHFTPGDVQPVLIDSGQAFTPWHRLMVEAHLPAGTAALAWVASTEEPTPPAQPGAWQPHALGQEATRLFEEAARPGVPQAAWVREPCELPAHPGLLGGPGLAGVRGLFNVLLQANVAGSRQLRGRYLWLRLALRGDGRATPEVAAVRAWAHGPQWAAQYLPRLYRDTEAQAAHGVAQADFMARFLGLFESVLTPLEARVADSHLSTHPQAVPAQHLDWLGSWLGVAFDPALGEAARRQWLQAAGTLARWHGTLRGLNLALDIATQGAVQRGEVVVVEDFRLRRLLATLIGVDLRDAHDPLLPGLSISGNSTVGDTLFVGDAPRAELMALFREVQASAQENAVVLDFDRLLAHRATVLVHRAAGTTAGTTAEAQEAQLALLRRVVRHEAPAHVAVRVAAATWPLLVGVASLVGVDTHLGPARSAQAAQVQRSALGQGDVVTGAALLDPRLAGGYTPWAVPPPPSVAALPLAHAGEDQQVAGNASFTLDGSASRAAAGRQISEYRWQWVPPEVF